MCKQGRCSLCTWCRYNAPCGQWGFTNHHLTLTENYPQDRKAFSFCKIFIKILQECESALTTQQSALVVVVMVSVVVLVVVVMSVVVLVVVFVVMLGS